MKFSRFCLVLPAEVEKQLQDIEIYEDTDFKESDLVKLVEKSNTTFQSLRKNNLITEKELKIFCYKKSKILVRCIFFRKFMRLDNVPGLPVISNCGTPTEKASEFLYHHLISVSRPLY